MKPKSALRSFLAIAGSSLLAISHSHAADGTWNIDTTPGLWSLNTNWLSNNIADGSGFTANFTNNITGDRTVRLDSDRTLTSLVFGDSDISSAGSWLIDNNAVSTNNLILAGTTPGITVNALGTAKTATISAIIQGSAGLVKSGDGTLVLSGTNTYTGTTTVSAGTLKLQGGAFNANTSARNYSISSGAVLHVDGISAAQSAQTISGNGTLRITNSLWNGKVNGGALTTMSLGAGALIDIQSGATLENGGWAPFTWSGNQASMQVDGALNVADGSNITIDALTGIGTISKGWGTNTQTLTVGTANGSGTFSGSISNSGGGAIAFTKNGTGTQTLSGNNSYTGATTVNAGTLVAGSNAPSGGVGIVGAFGNATSEISLGTAGAATAAGILTNGTFTIGRIIRNATSNSTDTGARVLTLGGNSAHDSVFSGNIFLGTTNQTSKGVQLTAAAGGKSTFSGVIQNPTGQDGTEAASAAALTAVTKVGAGTVVLSGTNTYTGKTAVNEGTLLTTKAAALPGYNAASKVSVLSGATLSVNVDAGGWDSTQIGTLLGATPAAFASGSKLGIDVTTGSFTYSTNIGTTQAAKGLVKSGAGTLVLDTTHTYTGATSVDGGTLLVNGSISTSVSTTVSTGATLAGTGTVGAATIQSTGILAPGHAGIESLNTGTLTLSSGSFSNFEINTTGDLSDLAISSALLAFGGTLNVTNIGGALVDGDIFNLFDWASTSGAFSAVNLPALDPGLSWDTGSLYTTGTIAVIPEPSAALLGGLGMLALLRRRRA